MRRWEPQGHWCFYKHAEHWKLGRKQTQGFPPFPCPLSSVQWPCASQQVTRWWPQLAPRDRAAISSGPTGGPTSSSLGSSAHFDRQGEDPGDMDLTALAVALESISFQLTYISLQPVSSLGKLTHEHPLPAVPPSQQSPQCPAPKAPLGTGGAQTGAAQGRTLPSHFSPSGLSWPFPWCSGTRPGD